LEPARSWKALVCQSGLSSHSIDEIRELGAAVWPELLVRVQSANDPERGYVAIEREVLGPNEIPASDPLLAIIVHDPPLHRPCY
jgi:hypothetical protein